MHTTPPPRPRPPSAGPDSGPPDFALVDVFELISNQSGAIALASGTKLCFNAAAELAGLFQGDVRLVAAALVQHVGEATRASAHREIGIHASLRRSGQIRALVRFDVNESGPGALHRSDVSFRFEAELARVSGLKNRLPVDPERDAKEARLGCFAAMFTESVSATLGELDKALDDGDEPRLARLADRLKSCAKAVAAMRPHFPPPAPASRPFVLVQARIGKERR